MFAVRVLRGGGGAAAGRPDGGDLFHGKRVVSGGHAAGYGSNRQGILQSMSTIKQSWSRVQDTEKFRQEVDRIFKKNPAKRYLTAKSAKNTKKP